MGTGWKLPYLYGKRVAGKSGLGQSEVRGGVPLIGPGHFSQLPSFRINRAISSLSPFTLHHLLKMELTQCSETSAFNTQTPGKYPEDNLSLQQHGESLKT
jgi:hypothetical protein